MKTWNDYKEHIKNADPLSKKDIEEMEELASIAGSVIRQRNSLLPEQKPLQQSQTLKPC